MALTKTQVRLDSLKVNYDGAGAVVGVEVSYSYAVVEDGIQVGDRLSVTRDMWPQLTAAQQTAAGTFFNRIKQLVEA